MLFSKTLMIRFMVVASIVVVCWSLWKRLDAIIDNYQYYYNVALMQKIFEEDEKKFDKEFREFDSQFGKLSKENRDTNNTNSDVDKKWEEYQEKAPFPAENKPVPAIADEYTKGYYHGLWNFFITSGFASIFAATFIFGGGAFLIRLAWKKINDSLVEKIFHKLF